MTRIDVINSIINRFGGKRYLEIGVRNTEDCFDKIVCKVKHSVDPGLEAKVNNATYKFTSDDFFSKLRSKKLDIPAHYKWDVIFIDGLHLAYQVERDVDNALGHLNPGGVIVMHDCYPFLYDPNPARLIEDYWGQAWNGTVWKVMHKMVSLRSNVRACTLDIDEGVGIVVRNDSKTAGIVPNNYFYEYKVLAENAKRDLNIIEHGNLLDWLEENIAIDVAPHNKTQG